MPNKLIYAIAMFSLSPTVMSQNFYVAESGDDNANGLSLISDVDGASRPFRTLARAQQAVRDLKKNDSFNEPVTVHVQAGTYFLEKALEFDIRDSGFAERQITWQAENGQVVISGGIVLQNCLPNGKGVWNCPTKDLNLDKVKYAQSYRIKGDIPGFDLFVDQQRMHLARWPNGDWAHIREPLDEKTSFTSMEPLPSTEADLDHAQVHIFAGNDWYDEYIGIASILSDQNKITLSNKAAYPLASGRRFYLQNIQSELDDTGEWFYDRAKNNLSFIPHSLHTPNKVIASVLQKLIVINGSSYINFKDFAFRHCAGAALNINKTHHVSFNNIETNNIGGRAVEIIDSTDIIISNSHIHDAGQGGILLAGGDRNTLKPGNNLVHNTHIHDVSQSIMSYAPAIEFAGVGNQATHNLVEQLPGTGILINGNDHLVEKNEVHHVCEQSSDCGAIYSGRDWTYRGNVIRYNSVHDLSGYGLKVVDIANNRVVYAKPDGVRGIYLDDLVSGFSVIGNLLNNAGLIAIQLGGGRDNIIENNIISTNDFAIWVDYRKPSPELKRRLTQVPYKSEAWLSKYPKLGDPMLNEGWPEGNTVKRNTIISTRPDNWALRYMMPAFSNTIERNLVWSTSGTFNVAYNILDKLIKRDGVTWQNWVNEGLERNSLIADPCLTITGNKATFCRQSQLHTIGIQPLPLDIGLIK
ncbi:MAG: hypothetical protein BVN35_05645 [Proteobacteria bacterium ST_bin11]|nr:MAG: hypothetical protein BVN35_05645 [Proteobacteria bacterium ST_bin11]